MTEAEWLACAEPYRMLQFLRGRVSDRKLYHFAFACCRHGGVHPFCSGAPEVIEAAEELADQGAAPEEVGATLCRIHDDACLEKDPWGVLDSFQEGGYWAAQTATITWEWAERLPWVTGGKPRMWGECCALLRCVFGNPCPPPVRDKFRWVKSAGLGLLKLVAGHPNFRTAKPDEPIPLRTVSLDDDWLTSTVVALAKQMYESRDFSPMPILADALQDAGCDSDDILSHCRGSGPHVRGCWVVDLVLGKS
jgi:hypothetical protein